MPTLNSGEVLEEEEERHSRRIQFNLVPFQQPTAEDVEEEEEEAEQTHKLIITRCC